MQASIGAPRGPASHAGGHGMAMQLSRVRQMVLALALLLSCACPANAQPAATGPPALPQELTPEAVDAMLSRLTDGEIRALLRDELVRRAEAESEDAPRAMDSWAAVEARLAGMTARIEERTTRWAVEIANLDERQDEVAAALARAEGGVAGMVLAALAVVAAGVAAAGAVVWATRPWRRWLASAPGAGYWDRVARSVALLVIEFLPIVAFVAATRISAAPLLPLLGPLEGQVWIYHAGVSWAWAFIVVSRRALAPDAPSIRIAPLDDAMARRVHRLLRRVTLIGAAGWLIAGMFYNLGLGFPPALTAVALSGTVVAGLLAFDLVRHAGEVRAATAAFFGRGHEAGALTRILVAGAPAILGLYLLIAWAYWLAHWLESGQHRLGGPIGTLLVYFVMPILDRLGAEIVRSTVRARSPAAERIRAGLRGCWRVLIGIVAVYVIARLWGLDLWTLAKGEGAPAWAGAAFDIAVAVLVGHLLWRLIRAALHTEARIAGGGEDVDPSSIPAASRLDTLIPLLRNTLLGLLALLVVMTVLASLGLNIGPLIASAGIVGIAVGFGAQTLVRDVFSGIFFLVDDAFRVGEYIELGADLRGEVEAITVRSLQLRHHRGAVITIPFGELKQITNHNRDWVIYKMQFRMEPDTDPEAFRRLVKKVGQEFLLHPEHGPKFLEPLKSQGVYFVDDDSALVMRVKFKCRPRAQFVLRREIYHRLRQAFAEGGLRLARRKVEVIGPGAAASAGADETLAAAAAE
jgi:moderate conductance mechanosensitive channel